MSTRSDVTGCLRVQVLSGVSCVMNAACSQSTNLNFYFGLALGLVVGFLLTSLSSLQGPVQYTKQVASQGVRSIFEYRTLLEPVPEEDAMHAQLESSLKPIKQVDFNDAHLHHDSDDVAKKLSEEVRVLCWIMTNPQNLDIKAIYVKTTWGKRCNKIIFFSSVTNSSFPTIGLNVSEGREHLTAKTMKAFQYIYDNHVDEADWFMKADDDTYVILENLRYFLSSQNTSEPVYFGHHFKTIVKQGYYSGGAGYVLSKEALRRFATGGADTCRSDGGAEDAELGKCMEKLGVKTADTKDVAGRTRFHCFDPETHLFGGYPEWYYTYDANGAKKGMDSISDYAVSFHYISPKKMQSLEFYIYHLRPYGIESGTQDLNKHVGDKATLGETTPLDSNDNS